jgi:hypothetical protein
MCSNHIYFVINNGDILHVEIGLVLAPEATTAVPLLLLATYGGATTEQSTVDDYTLT